MRYTTASHLRYYRQVLEDKQKISDVNLYEPFRVAMTIDWPHVSNIKSIALGDSPIRKLG